MSATCWTTNESNHNAAPLGGLFTAFRTARDTTVRHLETFPNDGMAFTAKHPRLKTSMNVIDLAYFVAEHDDYHLARISELLAKKLEPGERKRDIQG
jgi:hypothetical protein